MKKKTFWLMFWPLTWNFCTFQSIIYLINAMFSREKEKYPWKWSATFHKTFFWNPFSFMDCSINDLVSIWNPCCTKRSLLDFTTIYITYENKILALKSFIDAPNIRYLLGIDGGDFEIHAVNGSKDVCGSLYHTLPGLGHGHGSTPWQKDRLVAGTKR